MNFLDGIVSRPFFILIDPFDFAAKLYIMEIWDVFTA